MKKYLILSSILLVHILGFSQIPPGYYDTTQNYGGEALKIILNSIIEGHIEYEYTTDTTDVWDILKETDKDTLNADNVILLYSGWSVNAAQEYNSGNGWSREHVWAKSHGQFDPEIFGTGAGTDVHHLRPADISVNTAKNNRWFAECTEEYIDPSGATGSYLSSTEWLWKPRDEVKGDVARMMFYMATRYEGENNEPDLELIDYIPADNNSALPLHAKLSDLLAWHTEDPVSDWERDRNDIIYNDYQRNRNPFIDHPEWVECIWNNNCTGLWFTTLPDTLVTDRESYSYSISASGSTGEILTITSEIGLPTWLTFTPTSSEIDSAAATLTGDPEFSDIGTYPVSLKITGGLDEIYQDFIITVIDGNPIAFTSTPVTEVIAGDTYTYYITVSGDGGASFTLTDTQIPSWLNLEDNIGESATLTGNPLTGDIGDYDIIITLTDDLKKTITQEFTVSVIDPIDANQVIITQYYEGNSNDKYIEISNVGNFDIDLSTFYLGRWSTTDSPSGPYSDGGALSGTILAGETWVYKNSGAVNPAYAASSAVASTNATFYNGDDPIALMRDGGTWDDRTDCLYSTGIWGRDTGFYRKESVNIGNKNMSVLDGSGEWIEVSVNDVNNAVDGNIEYLGYHLDNTSTVKEIKTLNKIFPNPAENILYIQTAFELSKLEIIDLNGKIVREKTKISGTPYILVTNLKNGLYFLKLTDSFGKSSFMKFIKQ